MTSCIHLDIALLLVLFIAALTALRFVRPHSPNAELLVDMLNRDETGRHDTVCSEADVDVGMCRKA